MVSTFYFDIHTSSILRNSELFHVRLLLHPPTSLVPMLVTKSNRKNVHSPERGQGQQHAQSSCLQDLTQPLPYWQKSSTDKTILQQAWMSISLQIAAVVAETLVSSPSLKKKMRCLSTVCYIQEVQHNDSELISICRDKWLHGNAHG